MDTERRRFQRVTLPQPIRGAVGGARVYILDTSVAGLRVAHQATLPPPGQFCRLEVASELGPIKLDCEVVRTVAQNQVYLSALQIVAADRQSTERLRTLWDQLLLKGGDN